MKLKYIEDYYEQILEKFPELTEDDLSKMLKHGFQTMYTLTNYGADICVHDGRRFFMYMGRLFSNMNLMGRYAMIKYRIKYRIKYLSAKPIWNGIYYFGSNQEFYDEYVKKGNGRIKNKLKLSDVNLYKIKEEAFIEQKSDYFYSITGLDDKGLVQRHVDIDSRNIQLIAIRGEGRKVKEI